jgi:hypothetical protein
VGVSRRSLHQRPGSERCGHEYRDPTLTASRERLSLELDNSSDIAATVVERMRDYNPRAAVLLFIALNK